VTKPSIAGHGMNFQKCARVVFVGLSDSFERYYQAIRRTWRFGQDRPVECYVVTADVEGAVVRNIESKQRRAEAMQDELVQAMADRTAEHLAARGKYETDEAEGDGWRMLLGDCVERLADVEDESVGLSVFSPPFPTMYTYTNSARDMGNVRDVREMIAHYEFLLPELMRVLMPGRSVAVHLAQAQARKRRRARGRPDRLPGRDDRGHATRRLHVLRRGDDRQESAGEGGSHEGSRPAVQVAGDGLGEHADGAGGLPAPVPQAGREPAPDPRRHLEKYGNTDGWITPEEWIEWAAPVWYRASENYPGGIRETDVLNVAAARDEQDERHLCPLQLGVIERAVKLWSAPGETVLSPFAGVGSEGFRGAAPAWPAVRRRELKRSYFDTACRNLMAAASARNELALDVGA
jgi:hypothetical protein